MLFVELRCFYCGKFVELICVNEMMINNAQKTSRKKRKENIRSEKWQSHYDMTVMFFCGEKLICNLIFT